jgi:hypothetical protein
MTGSHYLFIVIAQLRDGVIDDSDLEVLSDETREKIKTIMSLDNR